LSLWGLPNPDFVREDVVEDRGEEVLEGEYSIGLVGSEGKLVIVLDVVDGKCLC
jgi:hypothetical protein